MVSLSDNCLGGERDRVYNSARVCVCVGGACAVQGILVWHIR